MVQQICNQGQDNQDPHGVYKKKGKGRFFENIFKFG